MKNKVVLILVDGLRPDALPACGNPFLETLIKHSTYCLHARTVMPSVTLPCHASLFFSVDPARHGITTNLWMPPVRPIDSLGDAVHMARKTTAMFYNWAELRDLTRPGGMQMDYLHTMTGLENKLRYDNRVADPAIAYLKNEQPDFMFLYLGRTDEAGHEFGWMTEAYLAAVSNALDCIRKVYEAMSEEYHLIVTADHGGHERCHGTDMPEDMTIPVFFHGPSFAPECALDTLSIKDIAPTIAQLLNIPEPEEWEGRSIVADAGTGI